MTRDRTHPLRREASGITEHPPTYTFILDWVAPAERARILEIMHRERRQTMNLRMMPHARLMRLTTTPGDEIVGWGGFDFESRPHAEVFSLFVLPEYRTYTLGLVIELARYTFLLNRGIRKAFVRMEALTNYSRRLIEYRIDNHLYTRVRTENLDPSYVELCRHCELFGNECSWQEYFIVNTGNFVKHGVNRIGMIDAERLPCEVTIAPSMIRGKVRKITPIERARDTPEPEVLRTITWEPTPAASSAPIVSKRRR